MFVVMQLISLWFDLPDILSDSMYSLYTMFNPGFSLMILYVSNWIVSVLILYEIPSFGANSQDDQCYIFQAGSTVSDYCDISM